MLQTPRTIDEVKKLFKAQFVYSEFPLYTLREESSMSYFDHLRDRKEFLSEIINTATGNRLYKFWTFTDWREHPTFFEVERGIDRFVYVPGKGIVGGSFDFYFYHYRAKLNLTIADFIKNIDKEKVMVDESVLEELGVAEL